MDSKNHGKKHEQTKHHQDHLWHCVPRCVRFRIPWGAEISPMSDAGGRKPGVAGSHCACRWYLQSLQVSNSHWKYKKNTLDTCWHMESWSMDPARSEDIWERPRVCVNFWGRNQWCSTGRKEHLVGKSCQPLFFQSISIESTILKGYAKESKKKIHVILFICRFCRGTITMFSQYVDTMFCINL